MKVEYDKEAGALYIQVLPSDPSNHSHTEELIADVVIIDRNKAGQITGIEVLGIDEFVPLVDRGEK